MEDFKKSEMKIFSLAKTYIFQNCSKPENFHWQKIQFLTHFEKTHVGSARKVWNLSHYQTFLKSFAILNCN